MTKCNKMSELHASDHLIYRGCRLISAPLAKNAIFKMAVSQEPINVLTNRFLFFPAWVLLTVHG